MTESNSLLSPETLTLLPSVATLGLCTFLFLVCVLAGSVFKSFIFHEENNSSVKTTFLFLIETLKNPFLLFLIGYAFYVGSKGAIAYLPKLEPNLKNIFLDAGIFTKKVTEFSAFFWGLLNVLNQGKTRLQIWFIKNNKKVLSILLPMVSKSLKAAVILLMLNILLPSLGFNEQVDALLPKFAKVALISILAWVVIEFINGIESLILNQYSNDPANPLSSRKIYTQVLLLKKVILIVVSVITVASILMVFDSVKNLGTGLLTTAGILSAIGAFASQQSLGRIFAGLQIAFTQPLRIGDTVIIDNEQGQVEEITLSYIVVKLWDLRRMIVPSDYFTNRGLQNLSRTSTDLLGTVFFYVDYMLPLEPVRAQFDSVLKNSPLWDGKVKNFQVTDIKESSMELRALVSAKDASTLWDLRCEVREKVMGFIIENYPQYLSKTRNINWKEEETVS